MSYYKKYIFIINCIIISEKKSIKSKFDYIIYFFSQINLIKYLYFRFFDSFAVPFKSISFEKYIMENQIFWKKQNKQKKNSNKLILVENFINQAAYGLSNAVIASYLSKLNHNSI